MFEGLIRSFRELMTELSAPLVHRSCPGRPGENQPEKAGRHRPPDRSRGCSGRRR